MLVTVMFWLALNVFTTVEAKVRLVGVTLMFGFSCPLPVSETLCVPSLAVIVSVILREPDAVGWNFQFCVQLELAFTVIGNPEQVPPVVTEKSPVEDNAVTVTAEPLVLL